MRWKCSLQYRLKQLLNNSPICQWFEVPCQWYHYTGIARIVKLSIQNTYCHFQELKNDSTIEPGRSCDFFSREIFFYSEPHLVILLVLLAILDLSVGIWSWLKTYLFCWYLTHWGRVTHICVSELTIIGSDNGLLSDRHQAIIWTNAGILSLGPLRTNFNEILIETLTFSSKKMRLKVSRKSGHFVSASMC